MIAGADFRSGDVINTAEVGWYREDNIDIDDPITHTMPLVDLDAGYDLMLAGDSMCGVVTF